MHGVQHPEGESDICTLVVSADSMVQEIITLVERTIDTTATHLSDGIVISTPRVMSAVLILILAYIVINIVTTVIRWLLTRRYPPSDTLIIDLTVLMVSMFLWFGVALSLLKVLGLDEIAASIGTAVGFIALGISYALSEMIEDTVSGVYLLRDPDFNAGDTIITEKMTGEVISIGLRKSRFRKVDGDVAILANRNVESNWTRQISST